MRLFFRAMFQCAGFLLALSAIALADHSKAEPGTTVDAIIQLDKKPALTVQLSKPVDALEDPPLSISVTQESHLSAEDSRNLTLLWKTVIGRNPVIQYGLKQLATPPELRYAHSSLMARTISGLLNGASLVPYMMGADQYASGATAIGTQLVDRALQQSQKVDPSKLPSDTELVELSGIVQSLQNSLVESYFQYKNSLTSYIQMERLEGKLADPHRNSMDAHDIVGQLALKHLQQTASHQKWLARQTAKRHYLVLERLVGVDGIKQLRFEENQTKALGSETIENHSPALPSVSPTESDLRGDPDAS